MKRHLLCHIYPRTCGKWRRTVDHLCQPHRWAQFTGRRVVAIAIDETCNSPDEVRQAFGCQETEFLVFENRRELQEAQTFAAQLQLVSNEPGITFRCHAKGATHADGCNPASHVWADVMFSACLDFPSLVDCALRQRAICGTLRSLGMWNGPGYHEWHFAGSFYWFRNEEAFSRDWRNIHQTFWGAEAWPGIFRIEESACLFGDRANTQHLYDIEWWRTGLAEAFLHWTGAVHRCIPDARAYIPLDSLLRTWRPELRKPAEALRPLRPEHSE